MSQKTKTSLLFKRFRPIIRVWKTDFRSPDPALPYFITLFNADSASEVDFLDNSAID